MAPSRASVRVPPGLAPSATFCDVWDGDCRTTNPKVNTSRREQSRGSSPHIDAFHVAMFCRVADGKIVEWLFIPDIGNRVSQLGGVLSASSR